MVLPGILGAPSLYHRDHTRPALLSGAPWAPWRSTGFRRLHSFLTRSLALPKVPGFPLAPLSGLTGSPSVLLAGSLALLAYTWPTPALIFGAPTKILVSPWLPGSLALLLTPWLALAPLSLVLPGSLALPGSPCLHGFLALGSPCLSLDSLALPGSPQAP